MNTSMWEVKRRCTGSTSVLSNTAYTWTGRKRVGESKEGLIAENLESKTNLISLGLLFHTPKQEDNKSLSCNEL